MFVELRPGAALRLLLSLLCVLREVAIFGALRALTPPPVRVIFDRLSSDNLYVVYWVLCLIGTVEMLTRLDIHARRAALQQKKSAEKRE